MTSAGSSPLTLQPGGEERLGQAVGAGRVQVADPGGEGRVQDLVAAPLQRLDPAVVAEVGVAAEVDVGGPAERGQAEPDRGDLEPGRAQGAGLHRPVQALASDVPADMRSSQACMTRAPIDPSALAM